MASQFDVSTGTGRILISEDTDTFIAVQLVASSLDADVTYKFQHSEDETNYLDITGTSGTLSSTSDDALVETYDFTLAKCYLYIDVGSATTGTVDVYISSKKKEEVNDVTATIKGTVDTEIKGTVETSEDNDGGFYNLLERLLKEQKETNKLLRKILN